MYMNDILASLSQLSRGLLNRRNSFATRRLTLIRSEVPGDAKTEAETQETGQVDRVQWWTVPLGSTESTASFSSTY